MEVHPVNAIAKLTTGLVRAFAFIIGVVGILGAVWLATLE